ADRGVGYDVGYDNVNVRTHGVLGSLPWSVPGRSSLRARTFALPPAPGLLSRTTPRGSNPPPPAPTARTSRPSPHGLARPTLPPPARDSPRSRTATRTRSRSSIDCR